MGNLIQKLSPSGGSGISALPPEVLEIIIKMTINEAMKDKSLWSRKHDFLVDIASVFPEFEYLAARKSLWRGQVNIRDHADQLTKVADGFFSDGITKLNLIGCDSDTNILSANDILAIADKSPNLRGLYITSFRKIERWPQLKQPLTSLKTLTWWGISNPDIFCNVQLHESLPNLESLLLGIHKCPRPLILPLMRGCRRLKHIDLCGKGAMLVCSHVPNSLRCLRGDGDIVLVNLDEATLKRTNPRLKYEIQTGSSVRSAFLSKISDHANGFTFQARGKSKK